MIIARQIRFVNSKFYSSGGCPAELFPRAFSRGLFRYYRKSQKIRARIKPVFHLSPPFFRRSFSNIDKSPPV
jgi:hypothetical protein